MRWRIGRAARCHLNKSHGECGGESGEKSPRRRLWRREGRLGGEKGKRLIKAKEKHSRDSHDKMPTRMSGELRVPVGRA